MTIKLNVPEQLLSVDRTKKHLDFTSDTLPKEQSLRASNNDESGLKKWPCLDVDFSIKKTLHVRHHNARPFGWKNCLVFFFDCSNHGPTGIK
jgi:hypothetical protein